MTTSPQGRLSPLHHWRSFPPNLIGHRFFMELDFSPWGNCKRRRREAAIAEDEKPLATRGSWERRKLSRMVWGGAPETVRILNIFSCQRSTFCVLLNLVFVNN